jgi:hypothetical protein
VFDESTLLSLADEYIELIDVDHEARKERDKQYEEGLRRTGLGKDAPGGATFDSTVYGTEDVASFGGFTGLYFDVTVN